MARQPLAVSPVTAAESQPGGFSPGWRPGSHPGDTKDVAWSFSGPFLDGFAGNRVVAGTGDPQELPGRYALAGLVDAHAHPTVAADERGPYLTDGEHGAARLGEYAAAGVTVIRDAGGNSPVTLAYAREATPGRW